MNLTLGPTLRARGPVKLIVKLPVAKLEQDSDDPNCNTSVFGTLTALKTQMISNSISLTSAKFESEKSDCCVVNAPYRAYVARKQKVYEFFSKM